MDGTIRDISAIVQSCKFNSSRARFLKGLTLGDNDILDWNIGRIVGMVKEPDHTIILVRKRIKKIPIIVKNEMITTPDQLTVGIYCRSIRTYDGDFYFPVPLKTSYYGKHKTEYDEWCSNIRTTISYIRMRGDLETTRDYLNKKAMRERNLIDFDSNMQDVKKLEGERILEKQDES